MKKNYFIKSYCRITNEKLICNDELILENHVDNPSEFLKEAYKLSEANYPKFHKMDLMCKSAFIAAEFISKSHNFQGTQTALLFSNRNGSWVSDEKHTESIYTEDSMASPAVFVYTLPNIALGEISIRHQLLSENLFLIFDKFSPENLIPYSEYLIQNQKAEQVLAGWVEVEKDKLDVLLYLVQKEGEIEHQVTNLMNLYTTT